MKTFSLLMVLFFTIGKGFAQFDTLPVSVVIKVDTAYLKTYGKNTIQYKDVVQDKAYLVKADSTNIKFFTTSLSIKNTSDRTIKIWLMTCSWGNNFIVNNDYIFIAGKSCDSNYPTIEEFKPAESKTYIIPLTRSLKFDYPCERCNYVSQVSTTRLGLVIIDDIYNPSLDMLSYFTAMADKSKWKIAWSNEVYLLPEK